MRPIYQLRHDSMAVFVGILFCLFFSEYGCKSDNSSSAKAVAPPNARFELLDPEQTGVTFINTIKEDKDANYFNANYIYIGGGIGVGDFDNNGFVDIYLVSVTGENKLYLNNGDFKFEDVTSKAGLGCNEGVKTGVCVVDINADGWLDIYQCRTGKTAEERGNKLFVNNGNGTFSEKSAAYNLNTNYACTEACFFYYDLDGDLDLYMINRPEDFSTNTKIYLDQTEGYPKRINKPVRPEDTDRLFRNNGNGSFTDVSQQAGIHNRAFSLSVNVVDFNNDGYPDIMVANDYLEPDHIYINKRNGTFQDEWQKYFRHLSHFSMGADVADINNDGLDDVIVADMFPKDNFRQKQKGTVMQYERYRSLVSYGYGHQIMRNMFQLNDGKGGFKEIACMAGIAATDWSWAPMIADYDNDGWKDVFITNGMKKDVNDLDFGNFIIDSLQSAGVSLEDYSKLLPFVPSQKLSNYMYRNTGDLKMDDVSENWGFLQKTFSNGASYADLDNDGDLDLIVHNTDDVCSIYKNKTREKEEGNFLQINLKGGQNNPDGVGAVVSIWVEGQKQVLSKQLNRGFLSSMDQPLHFGLGTAKSIDSLEVRWCNGKIQTLKSLPVNQVLTLDFREAKDDASAPKLPQLACKEVTGKNGLNYLQEENAFEDFEQVRLIPRKYSARGPALAVGDVNGDQLEDVFVGGSFFKKGKIFVQVRPGYFSELEQPGFQTKDRFEDVDAVFFDANGDGYSDLYVVSGGTQGPLNKKFYNDRLYMNDGNGVLLPYPVGKPFIDESGSCVAVFDLEQDGDLDIAVGANVEPGNFPVEARSFILRNEGGRFVDITDSWAPDFAHLGMVNSIQFADLNSDRRPEMIVTGEWMGIRIFDVAPQGLTEVTELYGLQNTEGWWNCLQIADLNGDGFQDIIAGNLGLNCRLQATPDEPLEVFATDIDHNGSLDPILTYFNDGARYPVPQRDALIKQVPNLKKKFTRYRTYASAQLVDILSQEELNNSIHLKAGILASCVFWGTATNKFEREELPLSAQEAPIMDLAIKDVNADGLPDVIAVGNDYGLEIESGRLDAGDGWIILGSKDKKLKVVPNRRTGFWANKEGRKVRVVAGSKADNLLILVGNNSDQLQCFQWDKSRSIE